ncbi:hypothetical protein, partial [Paraprevotella clara]|uniref:hypothetical protein n=1 Tax=Paraprevotella clara TaxID=454154 RepID=UPI00307BCDD6
ASDSGSEGRGLESLRGHERKVLHNLWIVKDFFYVLYLGIFLCFRFLLSNGFRLKKDSRLSQDSYLYINLISIMKNNSYSVHARLHDCSLSKRAMGLPIALIYRDLCFRMERFHQHLEAFANEKNNPIFCRFADFA